MTCGWGQGRQASGQGRRTAEGLARRAGARRRTLLSPRGSSARQYEGLPARKLTPLELPPGLNARRPGSRAAGAAAQQRRVRLPAGLCPPGRPASPPPRPQHGSAGGSRHKGALACRYVFSSASGTRHSSADSWTMGASRWAHMAAGMGDEGWGGMGGPRGRANQSGSAMHAGERSCRACQVRSCPAGVKPWRRRQPMRAGLAGKQPVGKVTRSTRRQQLANPGPRLPPELPADRFSTAFRPKLPPAPLQQGTALPRPRNAVLPGSCGSGSPSAMTCTPPLSATASRLASEAGPSPRTSAMRARQPLHCTPSLSRCCRRWLGGRGWGGLGGLVLKRDRCAVK